MSKVKHESILRKLIDSIRVGKYKKVNNTLHKVQVDTSTGEVVDENFCVLGCVMNEAMSDETYLSDMKKYNPHWKYTKGQVLTPEEIQDSERRWGCSVGDGKKKWLISPLVINSGKPYDNEIVDVPPQDLLTPIGLSDANEVMNLYGSNDEGSSLRALANELERKHFPESIKKKEVKKEKSIF